jgi:1-acyl-sn-glycerol-3-phosphate acyltransferase
MLFNYKAYGTENIPQSGSFIMVSNHVSFLDPIAIGAFVPLPFNYIAKKELFEVRYFGWYFSKLRTIAVDTEGSAYSGMKEVIRRIKKGEPIVIFPEGTRGDGSSFLEPETGVAYLALKFGLPVLPVYVQGTEKALPIGAHFIRIRPVRAYYGKPKKYQLPDGMDKDAAYKEVSYKIMEEIKGLKEKHETEN